MVVAVVIVINSVIGWFGCVDLIWLAATTVRLQVSDYSQLYDNTVRLQLFRMIGEKCSSRCVNQRPIKTKTRIRRSQQKLCVIIRLAAALQRGNPRLTKSRFVSVLASDWFRKRCMLTFTKVKPIPAIAGLILTLNWKLFQKSILFSAIVSLLLSFKCSITGSITEIRRLVDYKFALISFDFVWNANQEDLLYLFIFNCFILLYFWSQWYQILTQ